MAGRLSKTVIDNYRLKALKQLLDGEEVTATGLRDQIGCSLKTGRGILAYLERFLLGLARTQRGLRLGGSSSYYRGSLARDIELKTRVAAKVYDLAKGLRSLAFGPGTTAALCARQLREEGGCPVLVTCNLGLIDLLGEGGVGAIELVGGTYAASIHACVGRAAEGFRQAHCEAAIVGVSGIDAEGRLYVAHTSEVPVICELLRAVTTDVYIVFDSTKIGKTDTFEFTTIRAILAESSHPSRTVHIVTNSLDAKDDHYKVKTKVMDALSKIKDVEVSYAENDGTA